MASFLGPSFLPHPPISRPRSRGALAPPQSRVASYYRHLRIPHLTMAVGIGAKIRRLLGRVATLVRTAVECLGKGISRDVGTPAEGGVVGQPLHLSYCTADSTTRSRALRGEPCVEWLVFRLKSAFRSELLPCMERGSTNPCPARVIFCVLSRNHHGERRRPQVNICLRLPPPVQQSSVLKGRCRCGTSAGCRQNQRRLVYLLQLPTLPRVT